MTVLQRHAFNVVALAAVFGAGWAAAALGGHRDAARADLAARAAAGSTPAIDDTCLDRHAMEANANLVEQVRDYRRRLEVARQHTETAEAAASSIANGPPTRLVASRDEWARMAREGTIRVRLPCARWDGAGSYSLFGADGAGTIETGASGGGSRAAAAGLSAEDVETLADTYERAHAKTWATIRSTCEANASFRASMAEHEHDGELTDERRVSLCTNAVLDMREAETRAAFGRVAQLRAAGAGIERTRSDEQRIAFAIANAPTTLYDEMVAALGREKAVRVIDNGVGCVDETAYDVREPPREE